MTARVVPAVLSDPWEIAVVESLDETANGTRAAFVGGKTANLSRAHPEARSLRDWLGFSLRYRCPIALVFSPDEQVAHAGKIDRNDVVEVADDERLPHMVNVTFGGAPAPRYLAKGHPRYPEMRRLIDRSLAEQQPIWCVIEGSSIMDAQMLSPEEDEALCRWIQEQGQRGAG
jgi:hypothetical protein